MRQCMTAAGLLALGLAAIGGAAALARGGDGPKPATEVVVGRPGPSLAEELDRLKAEFEDAERVYSEFYQGSTIPEEDQAKAAEVEPDFSAVVRRIAVLAATAPKSPAARDAMLWVISQTLRGDG